mmetsp:Transcript_2450/g.6966  ORF Transcript_2450/g.6966 Transcript_2450/m.6966 type:complete len:224 (+) Transcript_2450:284-955(+)
MRPRLLPRRPRPPVPAQRVQQVQRRINLWRVPLSRPLRRRPRPGPKGTMPSLHRRMQRRPRTERSGPRSSRRLAARPPWQHRSSRMPPSRPMFGSRRALVKRLSRRGTRSAAVANEARKTAHTACHSQPPGVQAPSLQCSFQMCMSCLIARCADTAEVGKHQAPNLMCVRVIKVLLDSLRDCHARCLLKRLAWTAVTGLPSIWTATSGHREPRFNAGSRRSVA